MANNQTQSTSQRLTHNQSLWSMIKKIIAANGNAAVQASLTMESAASALNRMTDLVHNEVDVIESQQESRLSAIRAELPAQASQRLSEQR